MGRGIRAATTASCQRCYDALGADLPACRAIPSSPKAAASMRPEAGSGASVGVLLLNSTVTVPSVAPATVYTYVPGVMPRLL